MKPYSTRKHFVKNSGTKKLKVAKLKEKNLDTSKIRQELKDGRIMVHVEVVENQKFGTQL